MTIKNYKIKISLRNAFKSGYYIRCDGFSWLGNKLGVVNGFGHYIHFQDNFLLEPLWKRLWKTLLTF